MDDYFANFPNIFIAAYKTINIANTIPIPNPVIFKAIIKFSVIISSFPYLISNVILNRIEESNTAPSITFVSLFSSLRQRRFVERKQYYAQDDTFCIGDRKGTPIQEYIYNFK